MTATTASGIHARSSEATFYSVNTLAYREQIQALAVQASKRLRKTLHFHLVFHAFFWLLLVAEVVALLLWLPFFLESAVMALALGALFFTAFSYFALRLYFQAKKPLQFGAIRDWYLKHCRALLHYKEGIPDHHLVLGSAMVKLATRLEGEEYRLYHPPRLLRSLSLSLEKFGCWLHWRDVLAQREYLFQSAIDEHIKLIKCEPTNLEAHAALANVYVLLSSIYLPPRDQSQQEERWVPLARASEDLRTQFRHTAKRAIEEFKILETYAPNDPWVHAQLAYSYHDLQMPEDEIREYETLLSLRPDDLETLFRLGMRYFQCGHTAKGLQAYEELKRRHYRHAAELITFYS